MMKKKGNTRDLLGEEEKRRESYIASNVGLAGIISMEKWKAPPRGCNRFSLSLFLSLSVALQPLGFAGVNPRSF